MNTSQHYPELPRFVANKVIEVANEQERSVLQINEITGTIDYPYTDVGKLVHFWIGGCDNAVHWIYIGGSACWMCPSNHYLFFEGIPEADLPDGERNTWWVINTPEVERLHYPDILVYKITIVPEEQVPHEFETSV